MATSVGRQNRLHRRSYSGVDSREEEKESGGQICRSSMCSCCSLLVHLNVDRLLAPGDLYVRQISHHRSILWYTALLPLRRAEPDMVNKFRCSSTRSPSTCVPTLGNNVTIAILSPPPSHMDVVDKYFSFQPPPSLPYHILTNIILLSLQKGFSSWLISKPSHPQ